MNCSYPGWLSVFLHHNSLNRRTHHVLVHFLRTLLHEVLHVQWQERPSASALFLPGLYYGKVDICQFSNPPVSCGVELGCKQDVGQGVIICMYQEVGHDTDNPENFTYTGFLVHGFLPNSMLSIILLSYPILKIRR